MKLDRSASGFVFRVRPSNPPAGTNLGFVGYPLGNRLSLNQGKIIWRGKRAGVPLLAVKMLGAEGASGAPFIDDAGRVVGILQVGLGSQDVLGQRTSGVLIGLDLVRWWGPRARLDLCKAYPRGGIAGCSSTAPSPGGDKGLTLGQAREIATTAVLVREDLTAGWRLESTSTPSPSEACEAYFRREGLLSSRLNSFTNDEAERLSGSVMVYRTAAAARVAYQLTASDSNLECFSASVEAGVRDSLEADYTMDSFSVHRTTTPTQFSRAGFGDAASSGYLEWQLTDASTADEYVGRLYWNDVLAGNGLLGFQYLTYGDMSIFSFTSAMLSSIVRVTGYRP